MSELMRLLELYSNSSNNWECETILNRLQLMQNRFREFSGMQYYFNFHMIPDYSEYKEIKKSLPEIRQHLTQVSERIQLTGSIGWLDYYNTIKRKLGKLQLRMMRIEENIRKCE